MKFANVRELKNKTSELLHLAESGEDIIVTSRGKPCALIHHISEDDIEDYVLMRHPGFRRQAGKIRKKSGAERRKRLIMEKLSRLSDGDSFDSEFWQKQSPEDRFAATWKTIEEFYKMRGINGYKPRLQRSVQDIK